MNSKGNILILILIAFVVVLIVPPLIMTIFPWAKYLFQLMMIFIIYSTVRGYIGDGAITIVISAILIYFLVFKYAFITASLWVFQLLLGLQFMSVIIWGIGSRVKPG